MTAIRTLAAAAALALFALAGAAEARQTYQPAAPAGYSLTGGAWICDTLDDQGYVMGMGFRADGFFVAVFVSPQTKEVVGNVQGNYTYELGQLTIRVNDKVYGGKVVWLGHDTFQLVERDGKTTTWHRTNN